jgi:hypothetical protein
MSSATARQPTLQGTQGGMRVYPRYRRRGGIRRHGLPDDLVGLDEEGRRNGEAQRRSFLLNPCFLFCPPLPAVWPSRQKDRI